MADLLHKATILDKDQMARVTRRMAGEILEKTAGVDSLLLVGIRTRGVPLAEALKREAERLEEIEVPLGTLDITLYRDDLSLVAPQPVVKESNLPDSLDGCWVVLCDDVLYTGRTVRAALDALMDFGRPQAVQLAVLVDRGHRELPIQADYVGEYVRTSDSEVIKVSYEGTDDNEAVQILELSGDG